MFIKRGLLGLNIMVVGVFLLFLVILSQEVSAATGLECGFSNETVNRSIAPSGICGGHSIYLTGFGAVEICDVCHYCGNGADGVCPEHYSDGRNETRAEYGKTLMMMRVKRNPQNFDSYSVAFQTGNLACQAIGGDCESIQKSNTGWAPWTNLSQCNLNVSYSDSSNNAYFRAVCKNVPRKSDCTECPDPDCTTTLAGKTYNGSAGMILGEVNVSVDNALSADLNFDYVISGTDGNYEMVAPTGSVTVLCKKDGFNNDVNSVVLVPGKNIVDCNMNSQACNSNCTMYDEFGQQLCDANCNGSGGCIFANQSVMDVCDGKVFNSTEDLFVVGTYFNPVNNCTYENISYVYCCTGATGGYHLSSVPLYCDGGNGGNELPPPPPDCECSEPSDDCNDADCCSAWPDMLLCAATGNTIAGGKITANVDSVITRNYRKEYNGMPVTLKIIVYSK
ncbi:MAG: hypothetical protein ACP5N3_02590 [Candidatus Nanoarchaeia archaeon]